MKFTMKHSLKTNYSATGELPPGDYDSEVLGIPDKKIAQWYEAGFCNVEGYKPSGEPQPNRVRTVRFEDSIVVQTGE